MWATGTLDPMRNSWLCFVLLAGCSSSSGTAGSPTADAAATDGGNEAGVDAGPDGATSSACAKLPAGATKRGTGCTGVSGTFTEVTFDSVAGMYNESCSATPYKDQADFDANEGTAGAAGTTIKSHEDYVLTATCASGSIDYETTGSPKTTILFLWTKQP